MLLGNQSDAAVSGMCCHIRMNTIPELKKVDRWTEKRSMFGVYDNIGILGKWPDMFPNVLLCQFFYLYWSSFLCV